MNAILPLTIFRDFQPSSGQKSDRSAGDRARHRAKIKEKIKEGLVDIIAEESLVGKSGDKIIKVPIRSVKEYKFVYGDNPEVGTGDGNAQPGQVIGKKGQGQQQGQGKDKAGDQAGVDVYEVEITLDELKEMLFEELQLPNLKKTNRKEIVDKSRAKKDGYRRIGIPVRLDRFRTAKERVKRKKATLRHGEEMLEDCEECEGSGWIAPNILSPNIKILCSECTGSGKTEKRFKFRKEDQRFRHMEVKPKPQSNAAIIFIMDTSGSMDTQKKFLARSFFFLMHEFIKSKYNRSELVFIAHHTAAKEVTEDEFFHKGECYSDDTEVLTKRGWLLFKDTTQDDWFATRNLITKEFEWQQSTKYHEYEYRGNLINLYSRNIDLLVTSNHRILVNRFPRKLFHTNLHGLSGEHFIQAGKLFEYGENIPRIPTTSIWCGAEISEKIFSAKGLDGRHCDLKMSGDQYCAFMGMWLAEGSIRINKPRVDIRQSRTSKYYETYSSLVDSIIGRVTTRKEDRIYFNNRALHTFLKQFGHAGDKFIPDDIMNATPRQIEIFWKYFYYGDGNKTRIRPSGIGPVYTSSLKMADQLQELAQKLGEWAIKHINQNAGATHIYGNRIITSTMDCFTIGVHKSEKTQIKMKKELYNGKVFCVTVPNTTLYVRRNGKPAWCGNSGGTFLSSGLILAKRVIQERYDPSVWNNYVMHMTDGDNFDSDNPATIKGFKDLLKLCSLVGYGEIKPGGSNFYEGSMIGILKKIPDKNFRIIKIINKTDIWLRLKEVLSLDDKGD